MLHDLDELEFLSNAAQALADLPPEHDVFRFVGERLGELAADSLVLVVRFDPRRGAALLHAVIGPEEMQAAARKIGGEPMTGYEVRFDKSARSTTSEVRLMLLEGGLHQLTFGRMPLEIARRIETALGICAIYSQPFSRQGDYLGAVALLSRAPTLRHSRLIEVFVQLAAIAIQRRRAQAEQAESERRFRMLAENSRDVVFRLRVSPNPEIEYVSPAATHLTGYTLEELYGDPRLGAPCLYPEEWTTHGATVEPPSEPTVARCRHRDGSLVWAEQNFTAVRDATGTITAVEGIARDITKRKQAEDALIESDRRKTEFLAVLSHELRNPLSAIGNAAYVLGRAPPGGDQSKRALVVVERQLVQLTRLIDDLLDVTRITRGKIQLSRERLDLNELVNATVEDHRATFAHSQVDIEARAAPHQVFVYCDRTRVAQIIGNLLQNAAKFTPRGGRASVTVGKDASRKQAWLRVHNTGAPIPTEVQRHLFEPFVQADRTLDRSKGGLGLGLALVKGLVAMHGGSVEVQSDDREGTTFTIRLPLETTVLDVAAPTAAPELPRTGKRRVLVIEDNPDAADSLRDALELHDNIVVVASNGPEGIAAARAVKPDVVLCDIGLPAMNGYEVARTIRADPELRALTLVALSGYASPEDLVSAREAGFDRHIAKPASLATLERVISELAHAQRGVVVHGETLEPAR